MNCGAISDLKECAQLLLPNRPHRSCDVDSGGFLVVNGTQSKKTGNGGKDFPGGRQAPLTVNFRELQKAVTRLPRLQKALMT